MSDCAECGYSGEELRIALEYAARKCCALAACKGSQDEFDRLLPLIGDAEIKAEIEWYLCVAEETIALDEKRKSAKKV